MIAGRGACRELSFTGQRAQLRGQTPWRPLLRQFGNTEARIRAVLFSMATSIGPQPRPRPIGAGA